MKKLKKIFASVICLMLCMISISAVDKNEKVLDLTKMNSNMLYSEIFNMLVESERYEGKLIKLSGFFEVFQEGSRKTYACIVPDAAACCAQGLEIIFGRDYESGKALPKKGERITVTGRFTAYQENGYDRIALRDAFLSN